MEQENKTNRPENENIENENNENAIDLLHSLNNASDRISELEKENKELKDNLEKTEEDLKQKNKYHLQYYRQVEILKKALKAIIEKHDLKMGDVYEMMLESNEIDLDTLLLNLSK